MRRQSGRTMMELMTVTMVLGFTLTGFFAVFNSIWKMQAFSVNNPTVQENARQMAITLAAQLREAQLCTSSDSGCTLNAAIANPTSTSVTVYSRPSTSIVQTTYGVSNGNFYSQVGNGPQTTLYSGATLNLVYYISNTWSYHSTALQGCAPQNLTTTDCIGLAITTSVTQNGLTGTYTTFVRLRNSPLKTSAGS